jgi:ABC-type uncharacterized transport system ATPase subunit
MHGSPDVELHAISKVYDDGTVALRGITLSFGRGQIFAILGHNGAGACFVVYMCVCVCVCVRACVCVSVRV